jgi:hypothetical protein
MGRWRGCCGGCSNQSCAECVLRSLWHKLRWIEYISNRRLTMSKTLQTHDDFKEHLHDSIGFLNLSCESFDSGFLGEAKRLATTIRVLLHDTQKSQSLLGLLGVKDIIKYTTTAIIDNQMNSAGHVGLVGFRLGSGGPAYWAPLDKGPPSRYNRPTCTFEAWWTEQVINDRSGGVFTRRDLILALVNKEGGAHVDPQLDEPYAALKSGKSLGFQVSNGITSHPISDVQLHSVRQIAYELLHTFKANGLV